VVRQPQYPPRLHGRAGPPARRARRQRPLAEVSGEELAGLLEQLWGPCAAATWNRNRGAVAAWLSWCAANRLAAPVLPASAERRREHLNATRAVPRPAIERALSRRDVPLREKTLWRMLYETAARASEVLALNIDDPGLDARRALIRSKGGDTEWILHQLRHSAATHLGEQGIPLQLIMAKTRHRNPRTAMWYVRPGAEAVAEITVLLEPPRRRG
jgi:integrase